MNDETTTSVPAAPADAATPTNTQGIIAILCGAVMAASFFMPWIAMLSGLDLAKGTGELKLLWAIPICGALLALIGIARNPTRIAAAITGTVPFLSLFYTLTKTGSGLFHILAFGAYLCLICGAILLATSGMGRK
jgi:hypothetical protein